MLRELIRRMARENPSWGAPRIHAELQLLGFDIAERTVSRYLKRVPGPDAVERWKAFLRLHRTELVAMDFFTVPTLSFQVLYVLVFLLCLAKTMSAFRINDLRGGAPGRDFEELVVKICHQLLGPELAASRL